MWGTETQHFHDFRIFDPGEPVIYQITSKHTRSLWKPFWIYDVWKYGNLDLLKHWKDYVPNFLKIEIRHLIFWNLKSWSLKSEKLETCNCYIWKCEKLKLGNLKVCFAFVFDVGCFMRYQMLWRRHETWGMDHERGAIRHQESSIKHQESSMEHQAPAFARWGGVREGTPRLVHKTWWHS